jgi:hypothetical protein
MVSIGLTAIGNNEFDNLASKIIMLGSVLDVSKDRSTGIGQGPNRRGGGIKGEVKWKKFELMTHGRNAVDNLGVINWTAVPSV